MLVHHSVRRHLPRGQHGLEVLLLQQDHRLVLHVLVWLSSLPGPPVYWHRDGVRQGGGPTRSRPWESLVPGDPCQSTSSGSGHDRGRDALGVWGEGGWEGEGAGWSRGSRGREELWVVVVLLLVVVKWDGGEGWRWLRRGVVVVPVDRTVEHLVTMVTVGVRVPREVVTVPESERGVPVGEIWGVAVVVVDRGGPGPVQWGEGEVLVGDRGGRQVPWQLGARVAGGEGGGGEGGQ